MQGEYNVEIPVHWPYSEIIFAAMINRCQRDGTKLDFIKYLNCYVLK